MTSEEQAEALHHALWSTGNVERQRELIAAALRTREAETKAENERLKKCLKELAKEAHLLSVRLANAAVSKDDLKAMLAEGSDVKADVS